MRFLLDTRVFLWAAGQSAKLPENVKTAIADTDNDVFVSSVSLWEISIKSSRGKLDIGDRTPLDYLEIARELGFQLISLDPMEAASYSKLSEDSHFDPFDRMLIWQAISRDLTLVSGDAEFQQFKCYGLKLLWK
jgi:PIN domain nuclease of toxin-antitoxin system